MTAGQWLALIGMVVVIGALVIGEWRSVRNQRRAQRELSRLLGHPMRRTRFTRDARVTERSWWQS